MVSSEFREFLTKLSNVLASFGFIDFLDICLVAFIVYNAIKILRETRAFQLIKGLLFCGVVYFVINLLNMQTSTYLFNMLISNIIVVLVIVFQPEIRHTLESAGRSGRLARINPFSNTKKGLDSDVSNIKKMISEFTKACVDMSEKKIGSITVFERTTMLGEIIGTGTVIDAAPTDQMFCNVFYPKAPLHDGAAVVRADRIYAAGCILPLTQNHSVDKELGTRHRAAIGMSEVSDAVIIVTSEETGIISAAYKGNLKRELDGDSLAELLEGYLINNKDINSNKSIVSKLINRFMGGDKK